MRAGLNRVVDDREFGAFEVRSSTPTESTHRDRIDCSSCSCKSWAANGEIPQPSRECSCHRDEFAETVHGEHAQPSKPLVNSQYLRESCTVGPFYAPIRPPKWVRFARRSPTAKLSQSQAQLRKLIGAGKPRCFAILGSRAGSAI